MHARSFLSVFFLLGLIWWIPVQAEAADEKGRIEGLISHIENLKDAKFIRNGSGYDAKSAAKFLRGKWQANEKEIQTADDFIEKAASFSATTGKPYLIQFSDGREVKCGEYLKQELKKQ
ncbi:MAG: hypothetical protein RL693_1228 [Verrucomicrobiota bacterium]|jgi:hypothetical protein